MNKKMDGTPWAEVHIETLAKALGVTKQAPYRWIKNGVPAKRIVAVEKITGIPRQVLRPDLYQIS